MKSLQQHLTEALKNQPVIYDEKKHLVTYPMSRQEGWEKFCEENDIEDDETINYTAITFNYDDDTIMVETPEISNGTPKMDVFDFKCKTHLMDYYKKAKVNMQPHDLKLIKSPTFYTPTFVSFLADAICWTFNNAPEPLFDEPVK